jgi:hypothetical protein
MTKLVITIEIDNDAFQPTLFHAAQEVRRILSGAVLDLTDTLRFRGSVKRLVDANGNRVGNIDVLE